MKEKIAKARKAIAAAKEALSALYPQDVVNAYFLRINNDLDAKEFTKELTIEQPTAEEIEKINAECQAINAAAAQKLADERAEARAKAVSVPDAPGISEAEAAELAKQAIADAAEAEAKAAAEKAEAEAKAAAEKAEAEAKAAAEKAEAEAKVAEEINQ